jgi:hypothetical protein
MATWGYWLALVCLILAIWAGYHFLDLAGTVGDAQFLPPHVCDSACQDGLREMEHQANRWMLSAGLFVIVSASMAFLARRARLPKAVH